MAKSKTIEEYAREVAASCGFDEVRSAGFTAHAKQVAGMDPLALREAMSKGVPVRFGHPPDRAGDGDQERSLTDEKAAPDDGYATARAAADRHEQAGDKKLAAFLREHLNAAEASDKS